MFEYKATEEFDIGAGLGVYEYDFFTINGEDDFWELVKHYTAVYSRFNFFPHGYKTIENNTHLSAVVQAKIKEHNANLCLTLVEEDFSRNGVCIREMIVNEQKPNGIYDTYVFNFYYYLEVRARGYLNRGRAYARSGFPDVAIINFSSAVELDPSMGLAFLERGISYKERKNYDKAIEDFTQAINLNTAVAFSFRGLAYKEAGDFDKARADFAKALELNPVDEETKKVFEEINELIKRNS